MKKITLLFYFITCALIIKAQTNLVVNPGFEDWIDSSTPGLNWTPTTATNQSFSQETSIVHSGTYSLLSNHTGTSGTAKVITKPYITITEGKTYTFSFWYYADASTTNLTSGLRMWGYWENPDGTNGTFDHSNLQPSVYINLTSTLNSWQQFSTEITAPAGSGQVELDIRFYRGTKIYIDDVSLIEKTTGVNTPNANSLKVYLSGNNLKVKNAGNINTIEVYNALGNKIKTLNLINGSADFSNFAKGLYIIKIGKATSKIIF